ncbi:MAG: hypothetical protein RI907_3190, partial [Pseudomonadota bacterium]
GEVLDERGQALPANAAYRHGGRVFYYRLLAHEDEIPFEEAIVYQDESLLVADKPHFLPVTPKGRYVQQTLLVRLKRRTGIDTLTPLHRIDLETTGLVAFAVRPQDRNAYQALFRERAVSKTYEAIAPHDPQRTWPLHKVSRLEDSDHFMAMQEVPGEPNADTLIDQIEARSGWARYALKPLTGQRHQLRVHMATLGLPLWGDRIYPTLLPPTPEGEPPDLSRPLQLLARTLGFVDPITGQARHFDVGRSLDLDAVISRSP